MYPDGDLYLIRQFPAVYLYFVLSYATRILFHASCSERKLDAETSAKFKNTCYLSEAEPDLGKYPSLAITAAKSLMRIHERFAFKRLLRSIDETKMSTTEHQEFLIMVTELELCGHICQFPGSVIVDKDGLIKLDFLSEGARKILKRARAKKGAQEKFTWFMLSCAEYDLEKREFV